MMLLWDGNMYLLLNRDEAVAGVAKRMLAQHLKKIAPEWASTTAYLNKMNTRWSKTHLLEIDFATVNTLLKQDVQCYKDFIVTEYKKKYRPLVIWLEQNFDRLDIDRQYLVDTYINNSTKNFVKTVGQQLTTDPVWMISGDQVPDNQPVVIRNIINNGPVLQHRLANRLPFWFIDSGYTNFLTGKKVWHRLVHNHIHHAPRKKMGYFPADRLHLLPSMPAPWRKEGNAILVIENSEYHYQMFGTTLNDWRDQVHNEITKFTGREIEFRTKDPNRKIRDNLYDFLKNSDYYCVITDASASAIEAVWAGIPIITLNRHISIPVAKTSISEIDNLYRGPIGNWLCALSYSQFTTNEMYNGTALRLIEQYHV